MAKKWDHREYSNHKTNGFYELPSGQSKEGNTMSQILLLSDSSALNNKSDLLISMCIN